MTPDDYYRQYKTLETSAWIPDGTWVVCGPYASRRYVINDARYQKDLEQIHSAVLNIYYEAKAYLNALNPKSTVGNIMYAVKFPLSSAPFGRVRVGKGSPGDMEYVLAAGLMCGKLVPEDQPGKVSARQFVDSYFGIDCTGFASNYFKDLGYLGEKDSPVDIDCHYFRNKARAASGEAGVLWDGSSFQQGDVVLWMLENGVETRSPGHIAVIDSVVKTESSATVGGKTQTNTSWKLLCRESNGAGGDGDPRATERTLYEPVKGTAGKRYWESSRGDKVIVVRPFV